MKWFKKGRIVNPQDLSFGKYRIMCPTPLLMADRIRVFCGFCNHDGISRLGYFDLNKENPEEVIHITSQPIIDEPIPGMFDENGMCPSSVIKIQDTIYLYYFGFQKGYGVPVYMFTGLAVSKNSGESFERISNVPVLDRSHFEPLLRSGAFVFKEKDVFKIFYTSGNSIIEVNSKKVHYYGIHYAESVDGKHWPDKGIPIISHKNEDEYGFGRPYLFKKNNKYYLFYSIRSISKGYRIGYAYSSDGRNWERKDDIQGLGIGSKGSWDSEMMCYSSILDTGNKILMFYNGNNLGETGFGWAELSDY